MASTKTQQVVVTSPRKRDPDRPAKILNSAAALFAANGYHSVGLSEIGASAGIVGSGIYRHFNSKYSVLTALLEQAMATLLRGAEEITTRGSGSSGTTLRELVRQQIEFCLDRKVEVQLYRQEISSLEEADAKRLRRMQRRYNEEWIATLLELRPELDETSARSLVNAVIGAIQSIANYDSGLPREVTFRQYEAIAESCFRSRW